MEGLSADFSEPESAPFLLLWNRLKKLRLGLDGGTLMLEEFETGKPEFWGVSVGTAAAPAAIEVVVSI